MRITLESKLNLKPVRYIAITGSSARSCSKLKLLLKRTSYYCLVDCFKKNNELVNAEIFYTPDCAIMEIRSLYTLFSIEKKIQRLKESIPGIRLILYFNMMCRYPFLLQRYKAYNRFFAQDEEHIQLECLEGALHDDAERIISNTKLKDQI